MTTAHDAYGAHCPTFTAPEDFPCRYCGARPGYPCETPSGYVTLRSHKPRRDARGAEPVRWTHWTD